MSKKLLLIVNPTAGKRKATEYLPQIVSKLEKADFEVETRYTEIDKNATVITREYGKGNDVIAKGDMKHFIPQQGVYVYARCYEGKRVLVVLNGTDKAVDLNLRPYTEVLEGATSGHDVISGQTLTWSETLALPARANLIIEL